MMKRIMMMTLMAAWVILPVLAQEIGERKDSVKQDRIYCDFPYTYPSFPGGQEALLQFLKENVQWPDTEADVLGRVIVSFVVETDGSLSGIKVVKSLDPLFDKEALRVVKSMPKWIPGTQNGQPVRIRYTIPVIFRPE